MTDYKLFIVLLNLIGIIYFHNKNILKETMGNNYVLIVI